MSLLRRFEQARTGIAAQHDGTATPVLRPSSSSTHILAREDRLHRANDFALTGAERQHLVDELVGEVEGLGPLEPLLHDGSITEIMVNGPNQIYIERGGKLERVPQTFLNNEHVLRIINRIVSPLGRRIDMASPRVDARLADGSRVNAIIPPLSLVGPTITIRKFST